jgi:hypothetical protein
MKLFDYLYQYDYGHEAYLNVFASKRFSLLEVNFRLDEVGSSPLALSFQMGMQSVVKVYFQLWKIHFEVSVFVYNPTNLDWFR